MLAHINHGVYPQVSLQHLLICKILIHGTHENDTTQKNVIFSWRLIASVERIGFIKGLYTVHIFQRHRHWDMTSMDPKQWPIHSWD